MENKSLTIPEIRAKILEGLTLSFEKLLVKKAKENGRFVFWEDGKIVYVEAKELLEGRKP